MEVTNEHHPSGGRPSFPHSSHTRGNSDLRLVFPAVISPAILTVVAIVASAVWSWWWLAAIPFVWLGSICAQPNLNLADGCLSYVAGGVALIVVRFHAPLGLAILAGVISGYVLAFAEKMLTMKPLPNTEPRP